MAYQPPIKKSNGFGPQGHALVQVNQGNPNLIRFILREMKWNPNLSKMELVQEHQGRVNRSECDEGVRPLIRPGEWWISVNKELTKIYTIRPIKGVFTVTVDHLSHQKDQPPAPKTKTYSNPEWPPYRIFTVMLRVVEGDEAGMLIPHTLRYFFTDQQQEVQGVMRKVVAYEEHPKSPHYPMLMDFMDAAGGWDGGPIPYSDNILPKLQERFLRAKKQFQVLVERGQVKSIVGGHSEEFGDFSTPDVED